MRLTYDPSAVSEIGDAAAWYEAEKTGLAIEFLVEFNSAVERLLEFPNAWPNVGKRVRRLQLRRFPYGIIYQLREDEIFIVAVAHLHRRPQYWKDRLKPK
ncbi:toxin ParE1/3/4 [Hyphomicrobium sp. 1Nfss2.1]|uniref:type II toxin-antitoxin system RelE/ParE family toxin n=1 Tax=Hyphomicrobium sp. 1Nfss2.1 TaxID=3413936 RepID=UPI003C7C4C8D